MKDSDSESSGNRIDPEQLLRSRLRETTPEFEARFDALRRRLAHEEPSPVWHAWLPSWMHLRGTLAGLAAAIALAAVVVVLRPVPSQLSPTQVAGYGELFALDEVLAEMLPLTDPETVDALIFLPTANNGGHS